MLDHIFGSNSPALFAKADGGIFTKTATISADLVGKAELSIPQDDQIDRTVVAGNIGGTVGDPFKDTAGPSLNTMITVMSLIGTLFAALIVQYNLLGYLGL